MPTLFNISKASSLALHASAILAHSDSPIQARQIAEILNVSQAHLSKVLPRMAKAGLAIAQCGPGGGFKLAREAKEITLKEIYEAIEGPIDTSMCPFAVSVCDGGMCVLEDEFKKAGDRLLAFMADARLSDVQRDFELVTVKGGQGDDKEANSG